VIRGEKSQAALKERKDYDNEGSCCSNLLVGDNKGGTSKGVS
jgi:hypothetical protein